MNWEQMISKVRGGIEILAALEMNFRGLPTDHNIICRAVSDPMLIERISTLPGFNRSNLSKLATICQMAIYDSSDGPEMDGKRKALRRHWYAWYKVNFAQPFSEWLGEDLQDSRWGLNWAGRLSQTYAWFVDEAGCTYRDLWVEDASRMMKSFFYRLFNGCHIIVAVEKDSLFSDFVAPAKALGAKSVYSGKGKSSKAAIEKVLREHFDWDDRWNSFSEENPLIVIHVSDHDYDGEAVIGPTFAEQARRYTPHILEARVGIKPHQIKDAGHRFEDKWYQVKSSNSSSQKWAEAEGLFLAECIDCGHEWAKVGTYTEYCPKCGGLSFEMSVKDNPAHGFEVEALTTRNYYGLMVDALLEVLPMSLIIERLRDECRADVYTATQRIADEICQANEDYQDILAQFEELEWTKERFERDVRNRIERMARPFQAHWREVEADPGRYDFREYVQNATDHAEPWKPFSIELRTSRLVNRIRYAGRATIEELVETEIY